MKLNYAQFVSLGERMRRAQKAYFERRDDQALRASKQLELEFDKACADFHQGNLLDSP